MKQLLKRSICRGKLYLGVIGCVFLTACEKEYGPYDYAPTVNFLETAISLNETSQEKGFQLFIFNRKDKTEANVRLIGQAVEETGFAGAVYGTDFTIQPEPTRVDDHWVWDLPFSAGSDTINFRLIPLHNKASIENSKFLLNLSSTSENVQVGGQSLLKMTFNNTDEAIEGYELSVSPRSLVFSTPVSQGQISDGMKLSLTVKNLTKDIAVVKTNNFKFSMEDDPETSKEILVIPLSSVVDGEVSFYVFFAPNTSSSGSKSGQLYIQSYGVKDARVALRGTQL